jgi:menaquinone-dependent protoporphyrinogen oxidase
LIDAADLPDGFRLSEYRGAVLTASIHCGRHEPEMIRFVKDHVAELERIDAAFLSVSLSEAGAEDSSASPSNRAAAAADAKRMIDDFVKETGWEPSYTAPVAGALMYKDYGFLIRQVMKWIASRAGASTDTSKNHEFTDWPKLDRVIDDLVPAAPTTTTIRRLS